MCIFGGGDGGAKALAQQQQQQADAQTALLNKQADEARADSDARTARISQGKQDINSAFSGFNDDYFNQLSKSYIDYAKPQLDDQYDQAKKNITYALARKGTLNSSIAGDQTALLDKQYATNETGLQGTAADYANSAQRDVIANKNDVTNQLVSTGDADTARTAALSAAKAVAAPPSFSPLSNLFTNVSALAAQNKLASDANSYGSSSQIGARLFGSGSSPGSYSVS